MPKLSKCEIERQVNKTLLSMVAILIATLLYLYTKLDYGYFSIITTFALIHSFYSEIYLKTIERIMGPVVAFVLTFCIVKFLHDYTILYLFFSVGIVFIFSYYYARAYYSYAMLFAVITCAFMASAGYDQSVEVGIHLGLYWLINIIIGALIVLMVDYSYKTILKIPLKLEITKRQVINRVFKNFWEITRKIDWSAIFIAARITLSLLTIYLINFVNGWEFVNLQAIIAGAIIAAQLTLKKAHHRAIARIAGVLLGSVLAILYVLILLVFPSTLLVGVFIVGTLTLCIYLTEKYPDYDYVFLQVGLVIPLVLVHPNTDQYNIELTLYRAFGSLEGGIIGILMGYLFYKPLKKKQIKEDQIRK